MRCLAGCLPRREGVRWGGGRHAAWALPRSGILFGGLDDTFALFRCMHLHNKSMRRRGSIIAGERGSESAPRSISRLDYHRTMRVYCPYERDLPMKNPIISHMPLSLPRTGIMVTIGRDSCSDEALTEMAKSGATLFRFNASHFEQLEDGSYYINERIQGDTDTFRRRLNDDIVRTIRRLEVDLSRPLATFVDLAGPKLRVSAALGGNEHPLEEDEFRVYFGSKAPSAASAGTRSKTCRIFVDDGLHNSLNLDMEQEPSGQVSFKDGWLVVDIENEDKDTYGRYYQGRVSKSAKNFKWQGRNLDRGAGVGCNPVGYRFDEITTDSDSAVIRWAVQSDIDILSQSFVCHPLDAFRLRCIIARTLIDLKEDPRRALSWPIVGKLETAPAVLPAAAQEYEKGFNRAASTRLGMIRDRNQVEDLSEFDFLERKFERLAVAYTDGNPIESLSEAFDGLMVARGDLAVEIPKVQVPNVQRRIVRECRLRGKSSIIATEVLPSMQRGLTSARAEIGDINTAVFQEADVVMLAGEVASLETDVYGPGQIVEELRLALSAAEDDRREIDRLRNYEARQEQMLAASRVEVGSVDVETRAVRQKISMGARVSNAARNSDAPVIFASVTSGSTAVFISEFSPPQPIMAVASSIATSRQMLLHQGVYPVQVRLEFDNRIESFIDIIRDTQVRLRQEGTWPNRGVVCPALLRIEGASGESFRSPIDRERTVRTPNAICEIALRKGAEEAPESEMKRLLSEASYSRLRKFIVSRYPHAIRQQHNLYFSDSDRALSRSRIALRLRLESSSGSDYRVYLTWKAPGDSLGEQEMGFEMRPEAEYDVTSLYDRWRRDREPVMSFSKFSFQDLVPYWSIIVERSLACGAELKTEVSELQFDLIGEMHNERISATTESGAQFELDQWQVNWNKDVPEGYDESIFQKRYELEVEDRKENEGKIKEVVHDILAALNIPEIPGSTPKMVLSLMRSGEIAVSDAGKWIAQIGKTDRELSQENDHSSRCPLCEEAFS